MKSPKSHRILVSPLEWGLGHATRMASIIKVLEAEGHQIVIAADGLPYNFLHIQFPHLPIERLPMKKFQFSRTAKGFFIKLLLQMPSFWWSIRQSKPRLKEIIKSHKIDITIADNRYGFRIKGVPSIFITHQLRPIPPKSLRFLHGLMGHLHLLILRKFDSIWVPDFLEPDRITALLCTPKHVPRKVQYIGPQSWMSEQKSDSNATLNPDILIMVSGPEPQRSIFEQEMIGHFKTDDRKIVLLQGLPGPSMEKDPVKAVGNIQIFRHLPSSTIKYLFENCPVIICRAGTGTIFDLISLGKKALVIPTPGQTEQEYVTDYLDQKGYFLRVNQDEFQPSDIDRFMSAKLKSFPSVNKDLLIKELRQFILRQLN